MVERENSSSSTNLDLVMKGNSAEKEEECSVCVAVNIRPLVGNELVESCRECLQVAAEQAQVTCCGKNYLFDKVYGACAASPPSELFEDCIQPLVDMLFKGYNATVLAYGQTGSGKTYTMGSAFTPGQSASGVIPSVLDRIFERTKDNPNVEYTIRTSFVEIHKEEIRDLLLYNENKTKMNRTTTVSVREMPGGGVCLAGATEREVHSKEETGELLLMGSQFRATASTNMNSRSSRSHAIFTITLEQKKQVTLMDENPKNSGDEEDGIQEEQMVEDFLTAKMHLVDLAGSERAKRTKAEGQRLQEGIDINKGLLALGKVISSLVEQHRHVPYRDSKLTRLLQDSLGGNSRTVMIACVSPADINMEETINTLRLVLLKEVLNKERGVFRYANQARNIKNKPVVNRDPVAAQLAFLRQQLALARSELALYKKSANGEDLHLSNPDAYLQDELEKSEKKCKLLADENSRLRIKLESALRDTNEAQARQMEAQCSYDTLRMQFSQLKATLDQLQSKGIHLPDPVQSFPEIANEDVIQGYLDRIAQLERENRSLRDLKAISEDFMQRASRTSRQGKDSMTLNGAVPAFAQIPELADVDQDLASEQMAAAEEEAYRLEQLRLGEELKSLEQSLELKERQIKKVTASSNQVETLRQQYEKQLQSLENKRTKLEKQRHELMLKLQNLKAMSHEEQLRLEEHYRMQLKEKDEELKSLKRREKELMKVEKLKRKADDTCEKLKRDIERIKTQKVQLYRQIDQKNREHNEKIKRKEKEMLQLKKQSRATQVKLQKMEALHMKQQTVLRRKTEEAEAARKRLKELVSRNQSEMKNRRSYSAENPVNNASMTVWNDKSRLEWLESELDNCNQSIALKRMLDGEVEQRKYISRVLYETQRRLEHLGGDHQQSSTIQRTETMKTLLNKKQEFETKIAQHSTQIAEIQKMYEHARSSEEKSDAVSETKRWNSVKSISEAKCLLKVLFKVASDLKVQSNEYYTDNTQLQEESTELQEKLEVMANEMHTLRRNLVRAEAATVAAVTLTSRLPVQTKTHNQDDSDVEDLLEEINHVAASPNKRQTINIRIRDQTDQVVLDPMQEDEESESEQQHQQQSCDESYWELERDSFENDQDWELSPNEKLHLHFRNKKPKDDPEVLHFINARLARRGEAPVHQLTVSQLELELKGSIPNWHRGKKSRSVLIEEIRNKLMPQSSQNGGEMIRMELPETSSSLMISETQNLRCATPQAREFLKRREDMMDRLERARSRNGRRTVSLQPNSSEARDLY
eukprot:g1482.t1